MDQVKIIQINKDSNELDVLAQLYGTDKWSSKHHYTSVYYDLFKDRRNEVKKVLEIGVGEGASLRMWRDFFPNAQIYGAEIDETRLIKEYRISSYLCHQGIEEDLIDLIRITGSNIDLVIDDGSHKPKDQIFTCLEIMPALDKGAIYVIEDVADPSIVGNLKRYNPQMIKVGKRYDDRLIILRKEW